MDAKFLALVAGVLEIDSNRLNELSNTENIQEWDSLAHWELISEIERTYKVKFTMAEAGDFKNLGEIYRATNERIK